MANITFKCTGGGDITVPAAYDDNILETARKAGVDIDAPCSGNGTCGKCRLKILQGEVRSIRNGHLSDEDYLNGWRLACQSFVSADAVLEVPESAGAFMTGITTADFSTPEQLAIYEKSIAKIFESGTKRSTNLGMVDISLEEPTIEDAAPDTERLVGGISAATGAGTVEFSMEALIELPDVLRENNFSAKCLVRTEGDRVFVLRVFPNGPGGRIFGIAVDIGTTTVSATLIDLESMVIVARASSGNAQIKYGADVINRIVNSVKPGGRELLRRAVNDETLTPLIKRLCDHSGVPRNNIVRAVIASNTTMNHLLAGIPANSIRLEPFVPVFRELKNLRASDFNLPIHPCAEVIIAPNVGSYVGGDITAGTLASTVFDSPELALFIDLGTNGEIVIGNSDFLLCCACSAGPAFEGGDISCGMRATSGAIEGIVLDEETMAATFEIIGPEGTKPAGLCGSGIIDTISELFRCGIINAKGKFIRDGRWVRRDEYGAAYVICEGHSSATGSDIVLSEVDIDNFVRAKAAIFSGIYSLVKSLEMEIDSIEKVYVAGGIGSGIDIEKAINIGMLPKIPLEKYSYIGNSSLTGACAMLLSEEASEKVHEIGRNMTYLELSNHPGYMDEFVAACFLPHTDSSLFD